MEIKLRAGSYMKVVTITREGDRLFFKFKFNKSLIEEIKSMDGHKWHGFDDVNPRKQWSVKNSARNHFQLAYLAHPDPRDTENPYSWYDKPLVEFSAKPRQCPRCRRRPSPNPSCDLCRGAGEVMPYDHQVTMTRTWLTVNQCEWAAEMGTGKTLAAIMAMEVFNELDCIWVGPRSALHSVMLEFDDWQSKVTPRYYTYDGLKKLVETWPKGKPAPRLVVFDESSKLKNPSAQRTQAAAHLVESMRQEWGMDAKVLLMSGSPAPKAPTDWYSQVEIARPGFLREGSIDKFKHKLAIIKQEKSLTGGNFPKLVSWRDDPRKCNTCGKFADAQQHDMRLMAEGSDCHAFVPSVDEVSRLYRRLKGLVHVVFKKDCLDLPDKVRRTINCTPSQSTLNAAKVIKAAAPSTIQALTLLRELSDGFQYVEEEVGKSQCAKCLGSGEAEEVYDAADPDSCPTPEEFERGCRLSYSEDGEIVQGAPLKLECRMETCSMCGGAGEVAAFKRAAVQVPCPKEDALKDVLEDHDEVGRLVVFAGFTGSVDRCVEIAAKAGWLVIRADGRGWSSTIEGAPKELLQAFQRGHEEYPRVAFVGQPGAAGMGLNLTSSPTIVYWSNDFNAESRIQSEDRCHRAGMSKVRGCTIIDLVHLPSDQYIIDNLREKRRLQDLTLGQFKAAIEI